MPTFNEMRERARALAAAHGADVEQLRGHRIRVLRAVMYEGEAGAVFDQLARSLPVGTRDMNVSGDTPSHRSMLVTVMQDQHVRLVGRKDLVDLLAWQRALEALPPEIAVATFGLPYDGCPSLQLIVDGVRVAAMYDGRSVASSGDLLYAVCVGDLGANDFDNPIVICPTGAPTMYASVTYTDPRGVIGGLVDEIGKAALALAAR